jgi:hypothetical protein
LGRPLRPTPESLRASWACPWGPPLGDPAGHRDHSPAPPGRPATPGPAQNQVKHECKNRPVLCGFVPPGNLKYEQNDTTHRFKSSSCFLKVPAHFLRHLQRPRRLSYKKRHYNATQLCTTVAPTNHPSLSLSLSPSGRLGGGHCAGPTHSDAHVVCTYENKRRLAS